MAEDQARSAMRAYYERGEEQGRLGEPRGQLEFERTKEIVARNLPPPPAVVADIGGGPGRYALWLAGLGYQVLHRDLMPLHVEQLRHATGGNALISSALADARDLDLPDSCADVVLLLGPLYHLERRADRVQALAEARRVLRPGGVVVAAAITRWAVRMDGILRLRLYEAHPGAEGELAGIERTGRLPPFGNDGFTGYTHRPGQLRAEVTAGGFEVTDLLCVEGPAFLLGDLPERMASADSRRVVLDTARALERVPELIGLGPHLLAVGRRSESLA
jgi:SAM-dependent methyltransferase